jgi:threonine dehydrogenase-like Zn-dependent dehydrogenase
MLMHASITNDLHLYRGDQKAGNGFIMGHEFTGKVIAVGSRVTKLAEGDVIVTPFTINCGTCFYCGKGCSSRCEHSTLFGSVVLDGGQAQYARIPLAESTVFKAPPEIDERNLVLMADIFPTGYFAAANAFSSTRDEEHIRDSIVVLIGCGPVGLCALVNALEYKPRKILAVDRVASRVEIARGLGAEAWNDQEDGQALRRRVLELTGGRGADIVIEVVGHSDALEFGFQLLRPFGKISSVGIHNGEIPWSGNQAYGKNLKFEIGRCPVRSTYFSILLELIWGSGLIH